jgi:hypothetical protein
MAGPADFGFDLLPPDPGVLNADLALEAALAPVVVIGIPEPPPIGRGWAFDFLAGEFLLNGSAPAEVSGLDQLRMWIEKTLRTARFAHPIYSESYGMEEPDQLIGEVYEGELAGAYQEAIVDALTVHDRIAAVDGFYFEHDPSDEALFVTFTVTLDSDDEDTIQVSSLPLSQTAS